MAMADYRLCDVCEGKAFYDSNLNYADGRDEWVADKKPFRLAGEEQYKDPELNQKYGTRLDYVGDWAVLCADCATTHKCVILPVEGAKP